MAGQSAHLPPLPLLRLPGDAPLPGTAGLNTRRGPYIYLQQYLGNDASVSSQTHFSLNEKEAETHQQYLEYSWGGLSIWLTVSENQPRRGTMHA